jgi:cytochrome c
MNYTTAVAALTVIASCVSLRAGADDSWERGYRLAGEKGCFECHAIGHDYIGPSFRSVAERHRLNPETRSQLADVIRAGSVGHWGERFEMWPQVHLREDQVQLLVDWVVSQ